MEWGIEIDGGKGTLGLKLKLMGIDKVHDA